MKILKHSTDYQHHQHHQQSQIQYLNMTLTTLLITALFFPLPFHSHPIFLSTTDTPLHVREVTDPFHTAVCRGIKLSWAMQPPAPFASQFLSPIESIFDGDMRDALHHWGYTEIPVQGYLCDFDTTHHLDTAIFNLGIDPGSERRVGRISAGTLNIRIGTTRRRLRSRVTGLTAGGIGSIHLLGSACWRVQVNGL